ncbi:unnamed protein product [Mytilus coruscus]|uniref:Transglutaminase-like domain-containing protein n=1 Tax=Mytilus coruscus TaxID=42192 RepID=A0A6J8DQL6_MYTCO|nr:unnamed protein product [Mytilus coruscus]
MGANESKGSQGVTENAINNVAQPEESTSGTAPRETNARQINESIHRDKTVKGKLSNDANKPKADRKQKLPAHADTNDDNRSPKKTNTNDGDDKTVSSYAAKAPKSLLEGSFWELVQYLTGDDVFDDLVRVRAIYRWITSYDVQNMEITTTPVPDTPLEYFSKIQCDMGNLANLFYILCTMAEVPCKVIDGITKNEDYDLGELETPELKAQWNAVFVQNEWRLVDIFWAKWCVKLNSGEDDESLSTRSIQRLVHDDDADEEYFFANAEDLIWTHYPDEEKWQLLKVKISNGEFFKRLYVRERSREMGVTYPQNDILIKVVEGQAEFKLHFPQVRGQNYHFKHNFIRTIPEGDTARKLDRILHHFIMFERHDESIHFMFNIPVLGKFRVNIFACDPGTEGLEKFDLICSFVVLSSQLAKECLPLPDYPKLGWGPNKVSRRLGLVPITHEESSIYTATGILDIEIEGKQELRLEMKLLNPFVDSANMSKYAMLYWNQGKYIVRTRLPRQGIYGLKFFTRNRNTMEQENVLNYLIHCSMKKGEVQCLPNIAQDNLGPHPTIERLGIAANMHENGYIIARDGHTNIDFMTKSDVDLVGELHSNDPSAVPRMRVHQYRKNNKQAFAIDVPVRGEYAFNVYAIKRDEPEKLNNAYAFLINSQGRHIEVGTLNNKTLENSKNFWKHTKEVKAESIVTTDTEISIPVPRGMDILTAFLQKADRSEPQNSQSIQRYTEKGIDIYKVTLDDLGDYIFNIFQQENKFLRLVNRYIITRNDKEEELEQDAKEVLQIIKEERENAGTDVSDLERHINDSRLKNFVDVDKRIEAAQMLTEALKSNDPQLIRQALSEYQYNKPEKDDDLLRNSKKKIRKLEAKYDLLRAFKARELTNLDRAIVLASAINEDRSFDQQLIHAKRLRDRLAAMRTMQDMARNTDNRVVGEIRQYNTPPNGVHQTIMAALMLMGYDPSEVKTWKNCQKILGLHGEKSFLTQMSKFDPKDVNLTLAVEAKKIIEPYTAEQIHSESHEAASVFIWAENMIKEIESNAGTLGVNKMVPEHNRAKTEIEKPAKIVPQAESPAPSKSKKEKPTLVTLESLFMESPIPPQSPSKAKAQKRNAAKNQQQLPQQRPSESDNKINGKRSNPNVNTKANEAIHSTDSKQKNKSQDKNNDTAKSVPKHANNQAEVTRKNRKPTEVTQKDKVEPGTKLRDKVPIEEVVHDKDVKKPKTNFIAKNVKSFKPKTEEEEDDKISSYLSNYKKKHTNDKEEDDRNSIDGHLSIPENNGKPKQLLGGGYHGKNPVSENPYNKVCL